MILISLSISFFFGEKIPPWNFRQESPFEVLIEGFDEWRRDHSKRTLQLDLLSCRGQKTGYGFCGVLATWRDVVFPWVFYVSCWAVWYLSPSWYLRKGGSCNTFSFAFILSLVDLRGFYSTISDKTSGVPLRMKKAPFHFHRLFHAGAEIIHTVYHTSRWSIYKTMSMHYPSLTYNPIDLQFWVDWSFNCRDRGQIFQRFPHPYFVHLEADAGRMEHHSAPSCSCFCRILHIQSESMCNCRFGIAD